MKKIISAVLSLAMVAALAVPAFAINRFNNDVTPIMSEYNQTSAIKDITDSHKFDSIFDSSLLPSINSNDIASKDLFALYSYTMTYGDAESIEPYNIEMDVAFSINGSNYNTTVLGTAGEFHLDNNISYITGPLKGTLKIGNDNYLITVGFNKILQRDGISACVTILPENSNNDGPLFFRFGDDIVDSDIISLIMQYASKNDNAKTLNINEEAIANSLSLTNQGTVYATLSGYSSRGIAQTVYTSASDNRIYSNVNSYCSNMQNTDQYAYMASVHEVDYYLKRNSGVTIKSIASTTDNGINEGDVLTGEAAMDALQMCLEATGNIVGAEFINTILAATMEYYTPTCNSNNATVRTWFGTGSHTMRFEVGSEPCSVGINMTGNGSGSYTMKSKIEYYILNDGGFYYDSSNMASKTFSATF